VVESNPPNHLRDLLKWIRIRALYFKGRCGPCVVCGENGFKEVEEDGEIHSIFWRAKQFGNIRLSWRTMYVLCV
jgi:hypothetical protein